MSAISELSYNKSSGRRNNNMLSLKNKKLFY